MTKPDTIQIDNDCMFVGMPKPSGWTCYLFGNRPGRNGMVWRPAESQVPNVIVRFFMRICLGCYWERREGI